MPKKKHKSRHRWMNNTVEPLKTLDGMQMWDSIKCSTKPINNPLKTNPKVLEQSIHRAFRRVIQTNNPHTHTNLIVALAQCGRQTKTSLMKRTKSKVPEQSIHRTIRRNKTIVFLAQWPHHYLQKKTSLMKRTKSKVLGQSIHRAIRKVISKSSLLTKLIVVLAQWGRLPFMKVMSSNNQPKTNWAILSQSCLQSQIEVISQCQISKNPSRTKHLPQAFHKFPHYRAMCSPTTSKTESNLSKQRIEMLMNE